LTGAPFSISRFAALRHAGTLGKTLVLFPVCESTQSAARILATTGAPDGTVVLAEEQRSGRGRRGARWESPAYGGLWASLIVRGAAIRAEPQWLTIAASLAVCRAARDHGADRAEIKWPNDLVIEARKFGGVLGELTDGIAGERCAILGFGVNIALDAAALSRAVDRPAAALAAEGLEGEDSRERLLAGVLEHLQAVLGRLREESERASLIEDWRRLSPSSEGRRVVVEPFEGTGTVRGVSRGIGRDGALAVEDLDGRIHSVRFGGTLRFEDAARGGGNAAYH
jgi:BirA family biotin operon repressor/biotin-[acetyl-CoA-carboxylase] ligase